jgi:hypothetical protein
MPMMEDEASEPTEEEMRVLATLMIMRNNWQAYQNAVNAHNEALKAHKESLG